MKERRKRKKAAAENRIKVLGEALGVVDDEDGVLIKVYDDIQEELRVKTEALKRGKIKASLLPKLRRIYDNIGCICRKRLWSPKFEICRANSNTTEPTISTQSESRTNSCNCCSKYWTKFNLR